VIRVDVADLTNTEWDEDTCSRSIGIKFELAQEEEPVRAATQRFLYGKNVSSLLQPNGTKIEKQICDDKMKYMESALDMYKDRKFKTHHGLEDVYKNGKKFKEWAQVAESSSTRCKILCFVPTYDHDKARRRVRTISNTYGKKCDGIVFYGDYTDDKYHVIEVGSQDGSRDFFIEKTYKGWLMIHRKFRDSYDWFVRVDDDTLLIVENLRAYLDTVPLNLPQYLGFGLHGNKKASFNVGALSAINRLGLDFLVCVIADCLPAPGEKSHYVDPVSLAAYNDMEHLTAIKSNVDDNMKCLGWSIPACYYIQKQQCIIKLGCHDDEMVGRCLAVWDIPPGDARDEFGGERVLLFDKGSIFYNSGTEWLNKRTITGFKSGSRDWRIVSRNVVAIHNLKSDESYSEHYEDIYKSKFPFPEN